MHEFSIAQNIIDIALNALRENGLEHIESVEVEIGEAAGVVIEALDFAWDSVTMDTPLQGTKLIVKSIPVEVICRSCKTHYMPKDIYDFCPHCGDMNPEIIRGKDLRVSAIIA